MQRLLDVSPANEINFELVTGTTLERILRLQNKTDLPVAFKVKTTAPKRYCVRPNCSIIQGGKSIEVKIVMQPLKDLPDPPNSWKDKFLIQAGQLSEDQSGDVSGDPKPLFDSLPKTQLFDQKLMCTFDISSESAQGGHHADLGGSPKVERDHDHKVLDPVPRSTPSEGVGGSSRKGVGDSSSRERELEEKLSLERRRAEKLAQEVEVAREKERTLKQAHADEMEKNKDMVRSLETLQARFENLQAKSQATAKEGGRGEPSQAVAAQGGAINFTTILCAIIVVFLSIIVYRLFALPQGVLAPPATPAK